MDDQPLLHAAMEIHVEDAVSGRVVDVQPDGFVRSRLADVPPVVLDREAVEWFAGRNVLGIDDVREVLGLDDSRIDRGQRSGAEPFDQFLGFSSRLVIGDVAEVGETPC